MFLEAGLKLITNYMDDFPDQTLTADGWRV